MTIKIKFINKFYIFINFLAIFGFSIREIKGIVGGSKAPDGVFTYQVSVQNNGHVCGGAIIHPRYIITAAQCILNNQDKFLNNKFWVIAGTHDLTRNDSRKFIMEVEKSYVPAVFKQINPDPRNFKYRPKGDIAILQLAKNLPLGGKSPMMSLLLPKKRNYRLPKYALERACVTGFGLETLHTSGDKGGHENSLYCDLMCSKLKYADTTVVRTTTCSSMWRGSDIDEEHVCAQADQAGNNTSGVCYGDIGGPLVYQGKFIIGVLVSHRNDCSEKFHAAVYTRITSFLPFIRGVIEENVTPDTRAADYEGESVTEITAQIHTPQTKNI